MARLRERFSGVPEVDGSGAPNVEAGVPGDVQLRDDRLRRRGPRPRPAGRRRPNGGLATRFSLTPPPFPTHCPLRSAAIGDGRPASNRNGRAAWSE